MFNEEQLISRLSETEAIVAAVQALVCHENAIGTELYEDERTDFNVMPCVHEMIHNYMLNYTPVETKDGQRKRLKSYRQKE